MPVSREIPPHNLSRIIDFVNTLDVASGRDALADPAQLTGWLRERGLVDDHPRPLRGSDVAPARELREALRATLRTHTTGGVDRDAAAKLTDVALRGRLSVQFAADGSIGLVARAPGYAGTLARLLVPVAHASLDGTWRRVKACDAESCQEAFYDQSRNRSGRWCEMAVCGNRTKVRTYRSRRG